MTIGRGIIKLDPAKEAAECESEALLALKEWYDAQLRLPVEQQLYAMNTMFATIRNALWEMEKLWQHQQPH